MVLSRLPGHDWAVWPERAWIIRQQIRLPLAIGRHWRTITGPIDFAINPFPQIPLERTLQALVLRDKRHKDVEYALIEILLCRKDLITLAM
jgi:hypothetical protein